MSDPFATIDSNLTHDVDWDSFLNMDLMEDKPLQEEEQAVTGSGSKPVALEDASTIEDVQMQYGGYPTASSNIWQPDYAPQSINTGDMGGQDWPMVPAAEYQGTSLYIPHTFRQSRQIPTIDTNVPPHLQQMPTIDSVLQEPRFEIDPHAIDYPDLPPMHADMTWLTSGEAEDMQFPLGSFVHPTPTQVPISHPPLITPCLIDPALMGQAISGPNDDNREWEDGVQSFRYEGIRPTVESDVDFRLRNTLLSFDHTEISQSRNFPYRYDGQGPPLPPTNSPEPQLSQLPRQRPPRGSPLQPTFSPNPPNPTPKRTKPKSRTRSRSFTPLPETQGPCLTCGKNYRTSTSPGRCGRCGLKWERHIAGPPIYALDSTVPDLNAARVMLYPTSRGRQRVDDDVHSALSMPGTQDQWVQRWLEALNTPVPDTGEGGSGVKASWSTNQQTTFNQKAKMDREGEYSTAFVTARLRALWWEVVVFHGGGISLYPVGGDSAGYTEDLDLRFRERLEAIEGVLKVDKRTVMDVVEGRGVGAFVGNPWGFHRRKDSNNGCNAKKKDVLKRHRGDPPDERKRGRKKASRTSSVGVTEDDDIDDFNDEGSRQEADAGDTDPDGRPVEGV